ncbi:lysylphosphatidylglycerol synthase transmembrane domain-containing protein [Sorangium cellulosum]|uniref:lysylphosphatidylglycerol synthase transmembrane domain-containing protein n=1 Tax=Sorangium cellulosum TaxID=56 RepID=UPI00133161A5|nr:lysylphosphatidylglycerol synthase transmembrane domain-containing protein [Sorangium cellulosum]
MGSQDTTSLPVEARRFARRHALRIGVSLLLGAGLAWLLTHGGLPLLPPGDALAAVRPWTVAAYVASLVAVHFFRAVRWRHLLRPVGEVSTRSAIAVSWIAFAAILLSPLRTGEVVRPYLIARRGSVRLWEATGTVAAERIIDGLVLSLLLFAALSLSTPLDPLPDHIGDLRVPAAAVPRAAYGVLALFAACFALMALFFWRRDLARRATRAVVGAVSPRLAERLAGIVERVASGLSFLPAARSTGPFLLETLAYWGINAAGVWLLAWGVGLSGVTFAEACVVVGCIGIGILVPAGPGYFGAFQLSAYMALAMFFPEPAVRGPGAVFVFLLYVTQVGWHIVAAAIGAAIDPGSAAAPLPEERRWDNAACGS